MRRILYLLLPLMALMVGCQSKKIPEPQAGLRISPGPPRHFDVGDQSLKHPLPADVADGYLQFGETPESSYGLLMAHKSISRRSHERSDLVIYIYDGFGWFHVGEKSFYCAVGDLVYVPRGAVYSAENQSEVQFEFLMFFSPPLNPDDVVYPAASDSVGANSALSPGAADTIQTSK